MTTHLWLGPDRHRYLSVPVNEHGDVEVTYQVMTRMLTDLGYRDYGFLIGTDEVQAHGTRTLEKFGDSPQNPRSGYLD